MARIGALTVRGLGGKKRRLSGRNVRRYAKDLVSFARFDLAAGDELSFLGEITELARICEYLHVEFGLGIADMSELREVGSLIGAATQGG